MSAPHVLAEVKDGIGWLTLNRPEQLNALSMEMRDLLIEHLHGLQDRFGHLSAAHLAALIAWHVKQRGDKLGGLVFSQQQHFELKPQSRSHGVLRYFNALTAVHQSGKTAQGLNINDALSQLRRLVRPGSLVYILSDFADFNQHGLRHIRAIRQHNEVSCCVITDPLDIALPANSHGLAAISDGSTTGYIELGSSALQQRYASQQHSASQQ